MVLDLDTSVVHDRGRHRVCVCVCRKKKRRGRKKRREKKKRMMKWRGEEGRKELLLPTAGGPTFISAVTRGRRKRGRTAK